MNRAHTVSTLLRVHGVRGERDVRLASQALFNIFAAQGLGQATFEITGGETADLWIKHRSDVVPDLDAIDAALGGAGEYRLVRASTRPG